MTTLSVHATAEPRLWSLPYAFITRVTSMVTSLIEVFEEAQHQAIEAERKYPFARW